MKSTMFWMLVLLPKLASAATLVFSFKPISAPRAFLGTESQGLVSKETGPFCKPIHDPPALTEVTQAPMIRHLSS